MSGLTITGLHADHGGAQVLAGLDLTVADGALACVLGPSGCGKSTLLRVIAGFHRPSTGRVALRGRTLADDRTWTPAEQRRIGYMPQDGALFPHLTVAGNIGFGLPRAGRRDRVEELLDLVGLPGLGKRHPHQLSGGQQQRVALARALAPAPELLLLDEPFAALDAVLRADLRAEVAATLRAAGTTAVLVTHDQDEALSFADVIAVVRGGRIAQAGTPDELYHRPADAEVARTLGEANIVAAELDGESAATALGRLPLSAARAGTGQVLLRPRQLCLDEQGAVRARVLRSHFRGHDHRVELAPDPDHGLPERLIAYTDTAPPEPGSTVRLAATGLTHPMGGLQERVPAA
ncbi:ABC transporter ATP-binding protein [Kitasatospora sp. RB6PN24]|uniref:ABC transporter ATP-binding protein n=1 Tax=Kitasatospora humi TaxID=2893891 RepID=UPI001E320782|nr:ABC transporter ATP-binding protein [Kitasatospora humi]MCC9312267.1 ABC transporter ATP-binding protein [Kitasatospora humi]